MPDDQLRAVVETALRGNAESLEFLRWYASDNPKLFRDQIAFLGYARAVISRFLQEGPPAAELSAYALLRPAVRRVIANISGRQDVLEVLATIALRWFPGKDEGRSALEDAGLDPGGVRAAGVRCSLQHGVCTSP